MTLALVLCVGAIFMLDILITILVARPAAPLFGGQGEVFVNAAATERVLLQEIVPLPAPPGGEEVSVDPDNFSVSSLRSFKVFSLSSNKDFNLSLLLESF